MSIKSALETNAQLAEACKLGMRALDNPAMFAKPVVLLDATASDSGSDAPLAQMPPASREVVSLIRVKLVGAAIESGHARDGVNKRLEHHRVVTIGTGDHQRQRHAAPIYDEMALAAELASVRWVGSRLLAPRGLATVTPSMLAVERRSVIHARTTSFGRRLHNRQHRLQRLPQLIADWAAAGFKDTLLRWKMKPEVVHGNEKAIQPRVQA